MYKIFLKQGLWYTTSTILNKALLFITLPVLVYNLTKTEFAIVDTILIYSSIIPIIFGLESYQAFARFYQDCNSKDQKKELFTNNLVFVLFSNILLFIVFSILIDSFKSLIGINFSDNVLANSIILLMVLNYIFYVISEQLRWMGLYKSSIYLNLFYSFLYTLFIIVLFYLLKGNFRNFIFASCFASFLSIIVGIILSKDYFTKKINIKLIQSMLKFSLPLVGATLTLNLVASLDRLFVKYTLGNEFLAILSFGNRITVLISLIIASLQQPLAPLILNNYENLGYKLQFSIILKHFTFFLFIILLIVICFSDLLVYQIAPKEYWNSSYFIPILCLKAIFSQTYVFSLGLSIAKKTNYIMILSLIFLVLSFLFQILFINFFGFYGVVYGSFISSFIYFSSYILISNKYYKIEINHKKSIFLLILLATVFMISIKYFYLMNVNYLNITSRIILFFTFIFMAFKIFYDFPEQKKIYQLLIHYRNQYFN